MPTIIPRGNIAASAPVETIGQSPSQKSARERAIAKLQGSNIPKEKTIEAAPEVESEPEKTLEAAVAESAPEVQKDPIESIAESQAADPLAETKEETEAKPESKDPLSSQYAVLARKEKALRAKVQQQEAAMKSREDALKQREEALLAKDSQYKQGYVSKEEFAKNPWKYLAESGISYDQITEMALNQSKADPHMTAKMEALEAKLAAQEEALKKRDEEFNRKQEETQSAAYKQALEGIRRETTNLVKANAEQYELISSTDSISDVVDLIEQTWKEDQVLLTVAEAAAEVEKYLEEEALKLAKMKKIQSKLQIPGTKTVTFKESEANPSKQPQQMKTLTNAVGVQKPLTARERAILAMKGELKK